MDHLKLTPDRLSVEEISNLVTDDSCGAVSLFIGTTRDNFEGKKVVSLEYEAYESMALKVFKSICDELRSEWPELHGIAIYHRLGLVPCREASIVIAVSSPHRAAALEATARCIERVKAAAPVWKRELYQDGRPEWKQNTECEANPFPTPIPPVDKSLIQINVSNEELQQRIQNFIERKREQVNVSNIHDFTPGEVAEDEESCARVRTQFVKRTDSKGHLKIRKVYNEWGPQTVRPQNIQSGPSCVSSLPVGVAERLESAERFLNMAPVSGDLYRRLKDVEDNIKRLQTLAPEYAHFWKSKGSEEREQCASYTYNADDIARKIEQLERHAANVATN